MRSPTNNHSAHAVHRKSHPLPLSAKLQHPLSLISFVYRVENTNTAKWLTWKLLDYPGNTQFRQVLVDYTLQPKCRVPQSMCKCPFQGNTAPLYRKYRLKTQEYLKISNGLGRLWHFHSAKWIDGADAGLQQSDSSVLNIWTIIIWGHRWRSNCIKCVGLILKQSSIRMRQVPSNQIKGFYRHIKNCKYDKTFHSMQIDTFNLRVLIRKKRKKEIKTWVSSIPQ